MRILTTGIREIDCSRFGNIDGEPGLNKPFGGCLWGSTLIECDDGYSSAWKLWTAMEDFKDFDYGVSYELKGDIRVMEIDSMDTYLEVLKMYSVVAYMDKQALDFKQIAQDFDAFHLTEDGFRALRDLWGFEKVVGFYSWDAESWVIFNPDCIDLDSVRYEENLKGGFEDEDWNDD